MTKPALKTFDIVVVGGGLAGLTMAASLNKFEKKVALIAPPLKHQDRRTTALLNPSRQFYETLGIWEKIEPLSAPLKTMRIIDGTKRLLRAPLVEFHDHELELPAFGYNVPNIALAIALNEEISKNNTIMPYHSPFTHVQQGEDGHIIYLEDGQSLKARLIIAADGRNSSVREAFDFKSKAWTYPQHALVVNFAHKRHHNFASNEFHTETGPFTQVPLPQIDGEQRNENFKKLPWRSSLVWVVTPNEAEAYKAKSRAELARTIEQKMHALMGEVALESDLQSFPLHGMIAENFAHNRVALIGESAHVFPPIGAQGFNLGVRDIKALYEKLAQGNFDEILHDPTPMLQAYTQERKRDAGLRTQVIDMFNRSLLSDFLPLQASRSIGLFALSRLPFLKKTIMKQSLGE